VRGSRSGLDHAAASGLFGSVAVLCMLAATAAGAAPATTGPGAEPAGRMAYTRGTTSAERADGSLHILGPDSDVQPGDTITTAADAIAILELNDSSRIVIRPGSRFAVAAPAAAGEPVTVNLLEGGVRADTRTARRSGSRGLRVTGAGGTVDAPSAQFVARVCSTDCAREVAASEVVPEPTPAVAYVGRVLVGVGALTATDAAGTEREIRRGDGLAVGDTVITAAGAHAVLAFTDGTRITVEPRSRYEIQEFNYAPAQAAADSARFRLHRGGFRAASGSIARRRQASIRYQTPLAVIGIRGTGFDVVETEQCGTRSATSAQPALTADVWEGAIGFEETNTTISAGQTVCLLEPGGEVTRNAAKPNLTTPRPDSVEVPDGTFGVLASEPADEGLRISVIDGSLSLTNGAGEVLLSAGEDGLSGSGAPLRTSDVLSIGRSDPFLKIDIDGTRDVLDAFEPAAGALCPP
jgi:hypothetical protein